MEQSPSWETNKSSTSQEIPNFCGTRRFIAAFTKARQLSYSEPKQFSSCYPIPFLENPPKYYSPTYVLAFLPSGLSPLYNGCAEYNYCCLKKEVAVFYYYTKTVTDRVRFLAGEEIVFSLYER